MKALRVVALLGLAWAARPEAAAATPVCPSPSHLMQWPSVSPVWEFCWVRPLDSSGVNGSGLEIHDVYYNGHLVLKRAHVPVLNVLYEPGGCGCFRDWSYEESPFLADNVLSDGYAEPTSPPQTVCETHSPIDTGFVGVAAEKLSDRLTLTTQFEAGWYRYAMRWTFFADGRIHPEFGFAAVQASCVSYTHRHHVYWRFDFDVDGAAGDRVRPSALGTPYRKREAVRQLSRSPRNWLVEDIASRRGYRIVPGNEAQLHPDAFAVADLWTVKYHPTEVDDSSLPSSGDNFGCSIRINGFVSGEEVEAQDLVVWYRGGVVHSGGDLDDCHTVGPMLEPVGNWSP
jgi:hypothetical protein